MPSDDVPEPRRDPAVRSALAALGCGDADELAIGGVPATALAAQFGTPLYAYDAALLTRRVAAVQKALGPRVAVLWSVKANPGLAVTRQLAAAGTGIEVASLGEFELALAAGHRAGDIRFAGPGKTDAELASVIAAGIGCLHVESADEVAAIAAIARGTGRPVGVAVRVNLPQELAGARLRMSGPSSRFGVDRDQVAALLQVIAGEPALRLLGLHVYGGTQCFDAAAFVAQATALVAAAVEWERDLGLRLPELDLGGGFGVASYLGDPEFDLAAAGAGVRLLVAAHDRDDRSWFVELGRFLAAPAGVYLTRIVRSKTSGGLRHLVLDGGLHHCALAAGVGTVLRRPPLLAHATRLRAVAAAACCLGGPLCTPQDQLAAAVRLPEADPGDLIAVLAAGAYGQSYSPTGFLSHPVPAEVMVENRAARLVRERGLARDVLARQHA